MKEHSNDCESHFSWKSKLNFWQIEKLRFNRGLRVIARGVGYSAKI